MIVECDKDHRNWPTFESLPNDQGGMDDINALVVHMRRDFKMGLIEENLWN